MGLYISVDELGLWLKHPQAGGSCQLSPCRDIRDVGASQNKCMLRVHGRQSSAGGCFRYRPLHASKMYRHNVRYLFTLKLFFE